MALFNEILAGRINRALQKFLSMKGSPPAPQLASEVVASLSLFWGAESRYLEGWNRFGQLIQPVAGGAGNFNALRLRNPLNSGAIAVLEKVWYGSSVANQAFFDGGVQSGDLVTPVTTTMRFDPRGNVAPTCVLTTGTGAALGFGRIAAIAVIAANASQDIITTDIQEIPLLPGDAIQLRSNTANFASDNFAFWWRERPLEDSEKQ